MKVYSIPTLSYIKPEWDAGRVGGGFHQLRMREKYLSRHGWETVESPAGVNLKYGHGMYPIKELAVDLFSIAAIWPTEVIGKGRYPSYWEEHNAQMREYIKRVRCVMAFSDWTRTCCEKLTGRTAVVIPQAMDPEEWEGVTPGDWRKKLGIEDNRIVVLWGKNAVDVLRDITPAVTLARMLPAVAVVATALPSEVPPGLGNLYAVGRQKYTDMQQLIASCDIYLGTTIESSGLQHLEAMWMGKPVLGYDWGGLHDVVYKEGRQSAGAELVHPECPGLLVDAFQDLVWRREVAGKVAHDLVDKYFTWPKIIGDVVNLYGELAQ